MQLKPLSNHVIIEVIAENTTTESGIALPDNADKKRQKKGRVVATGPGKINDSGNIQPLSVKTGNTVLYETYKDEFPYEGKQYVICDEEDILAVFE